MIGVFANNQKVVVILGGGLNKGKNGQWHTTNFGEKGDKFGATGDRLRVVAGACLYKADPDTRIIASGGSLNAEDVPALAKVIKEELIELGVPPKKIIKESKSKSTFEQLWEAKKIYKAKKISSLVIISNKYHLPRIKALISLDKELKAMLAGGTIKLESAESILIKDNPLKWKKIIQAAYHGKELKKRIELEKKGVEMIKAGTYKFK